MGRKVYDAGALIKEWDDDARTYSRFDRDGALVEERPYTDDEAAPLVDRETVDARETVRAKLEDAARTAMAANRDDIAQAALIRTDALEIADSPTTVLTAAQIVTVLKRLAGGIALLAEHDARTKRQANVLIRLAIGQLDSDE